MLLVVQVFLLVVLVHVDGLVPAGSCTIPTGSYSFMLCINRVITLENELGGTKKVLGGAVLKLISRLDALHELASTSLGGDATVEAAYTIYKASQDAHASSDAGHDEDEVPDTTTMPFRRTRTKRRRLRKTFTSSAFEHFQENISAVEDTIPAGDGIAAATQTILAGSTPIPTTGGVSAGSFMDPAGEATAAAAPSSTAILAVDKDKAPMLEEDLAKKLQAEQDAEFARQQEELAQKAQAESIASPTAQGIGLSDQCRRELDAAQLIYTEADWLELMAKIATNSALFKQLLGDDVNKDNMNERLGMLLMRKRRELAEQSRIKPMNKTRQQDFMRDFVKNQSASVYNQEATTTSIPNPPPPTTPTVIPHTTSPREYFGASTHGVESQEVSTTVAFTSGSLADEDAHSFWRDQKSWRICSWCLYPRAHVHVLETVDGRVMYMFVDVS
nr:hypothetical protein [Tanacetum cinerariifolium]